MPFPWYWLARTTVLATASAVGNFGDKLAG